MSLSNSASVSMRGFTLLEMLLAMAIGSIIMVGAARTLPLLQQQNLRLQMQVQLFDDLQHLAQTVEKFVRRAGYCHGKCRGTALHIQGNQGNCLLVRWDENSNGQWEGIGRDDSEYYGFRLRGNNLEMQRGVDRCDGSGWEKMNDPRTMIVEQFSVSREKQTFRLILSAHASRWPEISQRIERWIIPENL